jgi:hypothetical protein
MSLCVIVVAETQMQPELKELERYVNDVLGAKVNTTPWRGASHRNTRLHSD